MLARNDSNKSSNIATKLPALSVVIPTRDRANDLRELLQTIVTQTYLPIDVIIVDGSLTGSAEPIVKFFAEKYNSNNCKLKYVKAYRSCLTESRMLGVNSCEGEAIFFADDDILLDTNVLYSLATFLKSNPSAFGVQPNVISSNTRTYNTLTDRYSNSFYKVLMLSYCKKDTLSVRKSGLSVFPENLTKAIRVQRLSGCCCCYRREVFRQFSFDTNLKRWGFMEDLDFSYRLYKKHPKSLWAIPNSRIIHKSSKEARMPVRSSTFMSIMYWFYIFFKDVFEYSILNLLAFMWALLGNLVITASFLMIRRKSKPEWWSLVYLLEAYGLALRNFRSIFQGRLEFFNNSLREQ